MIEFLIEHGWPFVLTINAIGSFVWGIWVTGNIRRNKIEMQILRVDYQSWLDSTDYKFKEKLH